MVKRLRPAQKKKRDIRKQGNTGTEQQKKNKRVVLYVDDDGVVRARKKYRDVIDFYRKRGFISQEQAIAAEKFEHYWLYGSGMRISYISTNDFDRLGCQTSRDVNTLEPSDYHVHCSDIYKKMRECLAGMQYKVVTDVTVFNRHLSEDWKGRQCRSNGVAGRALIDGLDTLVSFFRIK